MEVSIATAKPGRWFAGTHVRARLSQRMAARSHPCRESFRKGRIMELRRIAVAIAALSFAVTAGAMGDKSSGASTSGGQKYSADQATSSTSSSVGSADSSTIRSAQQALDDKGYDAGSADGRMGPRTESALKQFQQAQGMPQTGALDSKTLSALGVSQGGGASSASSSSGPSGSTTSTSSPSGSNSMSSPSAGATGKTSSSPGGASTMSSSPSSSSSASPKKY
jgi:hypothetical protein